MKRLFFLVLPAMLIAGSLFGQEKVKIEKAEDLPKHNYQLPNTNLSELINDRDELIKLAGEVGKDLKEDLDKYEFADQSILKAYYDDLSTIAQLEGNYDKTLKYIYKARELSDKEAERLVRASEIEAYILARKEGIEEEDKFKEQVRLNLTAHLDTLPFEIIQEEVETRKGRAGIYTKNLVTGYLEGEMQTTVDNSEGYVPLGIVTGLISIRNALDYYLPNKEVFAEVFTDLLNRKAEKVEKKDIWKEREVVLKATDHYEPVIIGIWDTGVDIDVFPEDNRWMNKNEKIDGKDDDNNGYVDDVYGIAYDYEGRKEASILIPEAHNLDNLEELQELEKGLIDMMANIDSERAAAFKKKAAEMSPEEYEQFFELLNLLGSYNHGTHVAGIATDGNPFARILSARLTFDHKNLPDVPTMETAERWGKMYEDVLKYFRDHHVRVVNMSWSMDIRIDILPALRRNGVGKDEEERFEMAKKMFAIHEKAFYDAMEATPEILFVTSAGNSNNDVDFAGSIPSSFNFPNILTVGAVDIEGKKTGFTT
ncbi:MAG: S8 family serine peptidase, partial [Bacteroidales bacterium]